jgi:nitrogen fixation/metabolism regulation signal transduction histidine kinase
MSNVMKREVIYGITGIVTALMLIEYFFFASSQAWAETIRTWAVIIFNISIGLGALRLLMAHSVRLQTQRRDWQFSGILLVVFVVMILTGFVGYFTTGVSTNNAIYSWMFNYIYTPLGATLYPITGFYIFSAAYRAFRARNIDATLM